MKALSHLFRRATLMTNSRRRQRGTLAVEAAIVLPILLGVGMIGADMQRIHSERIRVENAAGAMALNLAAQPALTSAGVDALAELAMQGHAEMQQLIILNVLQSGRITWALERGKLAHYAKFPHQVGSTRETCPKTHPTRAKTIPITARCPWSWSRRAATPPIFPSGLACRYPRCWKSLVFSVPPLEPSRLTKCCAPKASRAA